MMTTLKQFFMHYLNSLQLEINNEKELLESWGYGWQRLTLNQRKLGNVILNETTCLKARIALIQLIDDLIVELEPTTLINRATGTIWLLTIRDKQITINVPNFNLQIYPLSSNKFKFTNSAIKLEIEFEKDDQQTLFMHLYAKGIKRASFEAL